MLKHASGNPAAADQRSTGNAKSAPQIVILSGISGAGKTTALKAFEDAGFEAIDNPPFTLLLPLMREPGGDRR
jgi:UPF0042 nucleotide-binding protein